MNRVIETVKRKKNNHNELFCLIHKLMNSTQSSIFFLQNVIGSQPYRMRSEMNNTPYLNTTKCPDNVTTTMNLSSDYKSPSEYSERI